MFTFEAMPPEINSGLMYTGPGAGPMTAASAAWDALADDLYLAAVAYGSAITDLASSWLGPSSLSMAAAGAHYVSWISATAMQAEQAAAQAKAAVAAYETAFTSTVPPAEIAANRALLLALVATNFFGQNTPAIMATEASYVEMWAQDASAMYGYAGASSAASAMTPFTAPKDTTNPSGVAGVGAAVTQAAGTSTGTGVQTVSQLSTAAMPTALQTSTSTAAGQGVASGASSSASMLGVAMLGSSGSLAKSLGSATSSLSGGFPMFKSALNIGARALASPGSAVSAASGRAASLGVLSVPQGWTSAAPAFSHVASALPPGSGLPAPASPAASGPGGPIGAPLAQPSGQSSTRSPLAARYNYRPAMVQRPVYAG